MNTLDKTEWEILNSTTDDWESLETIYRSLNLAPVGSAVASESSPLLEVVADDLRKLVEGGFLEARLPNCDDPNTVDLCDLSYIWRAWFRMTPLGRAAWANSVYAAEV